MSTDVEQVKDAVVVLPAPVYRGAQMVRGLMEYRELQRSLDAAMPDQVMFIKDKLFRKKGYWRAIAVAFGVNCTEVPDIEKRNVIGALDNGAENYVYCVTYQAVLPNGRMVTGDGACAAAEKIGFPVIIRPSFTLGGTGGSMAYNMEEFKERAKRGLESSMISEVLVEESVIGWKEFELEVMRDLKDNVVIICSIENFDPMGIHTGDSITVAPIQTLTDKEYQRMRNAAIACIREIGVETGGSNIQFAVHPDTGRMVIIEMNPRVSRSSALASKATGFPIAKIAAKLAVGYTLDEIPNDITKETPACFEPSIDYCVVKAPRFTFEKFPLADPALTVSMKSVGEAMSIGRTFKEALQKGLRSLEIKKYGMETILFKDCLGSVKADEDTLDIIHEKLRIPNAERIFYIGDALRASMDIDKIYELTKIDRWFLHNIKEIVELEKEIIKKKDDIPIKLLIQAKQYGFSDPQLAALLDKDEIEIRNLRKSFKLEPDFKLVDTCAAEFRARTPYYYSTYDSPNLPQKW